MKNTKTGWLDKDQIRIKIQLADTVISDHINEKAFT
jgi:hypothetical protein